MNAEAQKARDAATRVIAVCDVIARIVAGGKDAFLTNVQAQWAAEMGLIRIGEGVAKIPVAVRERFAEQSCGRSSTCGISRRTRTTSTPTASGGR